MNAAAWIAIVALSLPLLGIGIKLIMNVTRLIDAVERLSISMEKIAGTVNDHERRLIRLERGGRGQPPWEYSASR